MMALFFAIAFIFCSPAISFSTSQNSVYGYSELESSERSELYLQVQNQEPMELEDEDSRKPYEGFNVIAFGMIALTIMIIAFVVYKVFQRMNKSRKGDQ